MAMMLTLAKFSSSGAQGTLSDGLVKREEQNREAVEKAGGRLIGYYAVAEGEWDMVTLVETPADFDAAAAARANQFFTSAVRAVPGLACRRGLALGGRLDAARVPLHGPRAGPWSLPACWFASTLTPVGRAQPAH